MNLNFLTSGTICVYSLATVLLLSDIKNRAVGIKRYTKQETLFKVRTYSTSNTTTSIKITF